MKKYIFILIALVLLVGATDAIAAVTPTYNGASGMGELRTATLINNTGDQQKTQLSGAAGYLTGGKVRILGYTCQNINSAGTETYVALADVSSTTYLTANPDTKLIAESEALSGNQYSIDKTVLLTGFRLTNGLSVRQGAFTCVIIYYIQDKP